MFDQKDLHQMKNLQRLIGKVKAELDMQEVLAAADVLRWLANLAVRMESSIKMKELKPESQNSPIVEPTEDQSKKKSKKL